MKVKGLIEKLKACNPEHDVFTTNVDEYGIDFLSCFNECLQEEDKVVLR